MRDTACRLGRAPWGPGTRLTTCRVLPQGHFIVWEGAPGARMPWKGHHRHVFLFRHHLLVCKPRRDSRTDTFSYVFRNMMKVCGCLRSQGKGGGVEAAGQGGAGGEGGTARGWQVGQGGGGQVGTPGRGLRPASRQSACVPPLQLSSIDLNDQVEGDDRAFEVWHEREDSVRKYVLQARTVITKSSWVKEICGLQQRLALPVWRECTWPLAPGTQDTLRLGHSQLSLLAA